MGAGFRQRRQYHCDLPGHRLLCGDWRRLCAAATVAAVSARRQAGEAPPDRRNFRTGVHPATRRRPTQDEEIAVSLATALPVKRSALPAPKHIDVDGIDTRYYEAGSGEPIVFIYGGNFGSADSASSAPVWGLNFLPLSERFKVVAF